MFDRLLPVLSSIDAALDALCVNVLDGMEDNAFATLMEQAPATKRRFEAFWLRFLAAAERRDAWRAEGCRDGAAWIAWKAGERRGAARRDVELAERIASMPALAEAVTDGKVSKAKATELVRATGATIEEQGRLVDAAKTLSVEEVAAQVTRWRHEHGDPGGSRAPALTLARTADGLSIEGQLDQEGGEHVQIAIDTAVAQLGLPREVTYAERQAHGLVAISRFFLEHVENPPTTRAGRPTVVVTLDIDALAARAGGSARLDSGAYISGDAARRLACDAGVVRIITAGPSQPLDVGRSTRTISPAQARAVIHRDRHCRYEGCTSPPWACDVHHIREWVLDTGPTDLENLVLLVATIIISSTNEATSSSGNRMAAIAACPASRPPPPPPPEHWNGSGGVRSTGVTYPPPEGWLGSRRTLREVNP
jgi:hypothetical protein